MSLRDYQNEAINAMRREFKKGHKRLVLMLPTGSGKTHIAADMIRHAIPRGLRCGFVCDRIELIDQTSRRFWSDGIPHGVIQADHPWFDPTQQVQVCSIQTLARRKVENFDLIIIDEAHTLHRAHVKLMDENQCFVVGLTATPFAKGMGNHFETMVSPVSAGYLIQKGYLCDYEAYGPQTIDVTGVKVVRGDFDQDEIAQRADQPKLVADVVETWLKLAGGRRTICFATNIAHSKHLSREFVRRGVVAEHLDCYTGKHEGTDNRKDVIERFRTGKTLVLCNVDILTKGFDVPEVSCIIQARPTKSLMVHIQQIGRGLRIADGKDECIILDHAGNHERLGFIDGELPCYLDGKEKKYGRGKGSEIKETPLPKPCPSCDFLKPAGLRKCPACGLIPEFIEDVDTEEGELKKIQRKAKREYTLEQKQEFLAGMNTHAAAKGWREGRRGVFGAVLHAYKDKFGSEPPSSLDWGKRGPVTEEVKKFLTHRAIKWAKGGAQRRENPMSGWQQSI